MTLAALWLAFHEGMPTDLGTPGQESHDSRLDGSVPTSSPSGDRRCLESDRRDTLAAVSDIDAPPCAEGETISKPRPKLAALLLRAGAENAAAVLIRDAPRGLDLGIMPTIPDLDGARRAQFRVAECDGGQGTAAATTQEPGQR